MTINIPSTPTPDPIDLISPNNERPFIISFIISGVAMLGVLVAGALVWGLIAYISGSIFLYAAIFIGLGMTWASTIGFKNPAQPIRWVMIALAVVLTVASVLLGDLIFYTLDLAREFDASLFEAAQVVFENAWEIITDPDEVKSYLFGGGGALLGAFNNRQRR